MREVPVRGGHITLGQLLKFCGLLDTGGEIKTFLSETSVKVNGEHDNRRGRKLKVGDRVEVEGREAIHLVHADM